MEPRFGMSWLERMRAIKLPGVEATTGFAGSVAGLTRPAGRGANGGTAMTKVDYKVLLWKYMNHVGAEESVTYWQRASAKDRFTDEELDALQEIEDMERPEWAK